MNIFIFLSYIFTNTEIRKLGYENILNIELFRETICCDYIANRKAYKYWYRHFKVIDTI